MSVSAGERKAGWEGGGRTGGGNGTHAGDVVEHGGMPSQALSLDLLILSALPRSSLACCTHRVDVLNVREVHVVLRKLLQNIIVVNRLWSNVLVPTQLR